MEPIITSHKSAPPTDTEKRRQLEASERLNVNQTCCQNLARGAGLAAPPLLGVANNTTVIKLGDFRLLNNQLFAQRKQVWYSATRYAIISFK